MNVSIRATRGRGPSGRLDVSLACFLAAAALATLSAAAAVWSVPRGVSLVDEGFFLSEAAHPTPSVTLWAHIVHGLFGWTGLGLVALRWINVLGLGAVSAWFAMRAGDWIEAEGWLEGQGTWARHEATTLVFVGATLRLATFPIAVSYNTLNQACVLGVLGLLLEARAARLRGRPATWRSAAPIGFLVSADVFVKAPTAILLAPLALACWTFCVADSRRAALRHVGAACGGAVVALAVAFVALVSPSAWLDIVLRVAPLLGRVDPGHSLPQIAARFPVELLDTATITATHYRWVLVPAVSGLIVLAVLRRRGRSVPPRLLAIGIVLVTALFVARIVYLGQHLAPLRGVVQPYVAFLLLAAAAVASQATWRECRPARLGLLATLLAASAAGVFGSNRHWMMYWPLYATPWFAACAAAAFALARSLSSRWAAHTAILLLAALATSQTIAGMIATPMGLAPRWMQTEPLRGFPAFEGVLVDPETLNYLTKIRDLAGPSDGNDAVSIGGFSVHAEQVALGRRVLGGAWTLMYLADPDRLGEAIRTTEGGLSRRALVLIHPIGAGDAAERMLRGAGLPFPEGYVLRGSVENPRTHKPVSVYVPRQ